jgi:peptidoglycan/LPS O-acetylase OafA/YrhL
VPKISNGISVARILSMFWIICVNYFSNAIIFNSFFHTDYHQTIANSESFINTMSSNSWLADRIMFCFSYAGWSGVVIFAILSGFSLWYSNLQSKTFTISNYIQKRFTRIYVPYLISIPFAFAIGLFTQDTGLVPNSLAGMITGAVKFIGNAYTYNPPMWFITLALLLYLFYPIIPILYSKFKIWHVVVMIAILYLFNEFASSLSSTLYPLLPFWIYFCIGILLIHFIYKYRDYTFNTKRYKLNFITLLSIIAIPITLYAMYQFIYIQPQNTSYDWHILNPYWLGLIGMIFFFSIGYLLPTKWNNVLKWLSRGTFAVFLSHYIILPLIARSLGQIGHISIAFIGYYIILLAVLSVIQSYSDKLINKYIKPIFQTEYKS